MKKLIIACALICVLILTGCPKKNKIRQAAEASYQFSGLVLDLVKATDRAYTEGLITLETKDQAVPYLRMLNEGATKFTLLAKQMHEAGEQPTPDKLAILNKVLSDEVITPFLALLQRLGVVAAERAEYLRTAISAIRIAILTISGAIGELGGNIDGRLNSYAG